MFTGLNKTILINECIFIFGKQKALIKITSQRNICANDKS